MERNILVSIIVPVHNTPGNILKESLECIANQDFSSMEVICVDDCSTIEETVSVEREIRDKYCNRFILYALEKNIGAAGARNYGLEQARGEYCIFLDSDDLFSKDFITRLYSKITEDEADVCLCEFSVVNVTQGQIFVKNRVHMNFDFKDVCDNEDLLLKIPASGCNRLCRKDYLLANNICFQNLKSDNDLYYSLKTILCTKRITILHDCSLFLYRFDTEFQISSNINPLNMLKAINKVLSEEMKLYRNSNEMVAIYAIVTGLYELKMCKNEQIAKEFYEIMKTFFINYSPKYKCPRVNLYIDYWKKQSFSNKWFLKFDDFYTQLFDHTNELLKIVCSKNSLFLWGRGKRGMAFERWCLENNVKIGGVCDISDTDIGRDDEFGNHILESDFVKQANGVIIASNHMIYEDLISNYAFDEVIDLELFCPL